MPQPKPRLIAELVREERYGKTVLTHPIMDALRRTQCLCLNCARLNVTDKKRNCPLAQGVYEMIEKYPSAFMCTRCAMFTPKEP